MPIRTRLTAAITLALALCLLAGSAASASVLFGLGDEHPQAFSDKAFTALGVKRTRLITPYDVALRAPGSLNAYMSAAQAAHEQLVVAFNPTSGAKCPARPCVLPSTSGYTKAFKAFHKAYPKVKIFQPWNEVNSLTQPTAFHPEAVVAYYSIVKRLCRGCTVLGADIEDLQTGPGVPAKIDETAYAKQLLVSFRRAHVPTPQIWGLHNYVDVNYFRMTGTKAALKVLPGQIWLTETGGLYRFVLSNGHVRLAPSESRQLKATKWLLKIAGSNRRIARVYIYDLLYSPTNRFDSSLEGAAGPRSSYYSLFFHDKKLFG